MDMPSLMLRIDDTKLLSEPYVLLSIWIDRSVSVPPNVLEAFPRNSATLVISPDLPETLESDHSIIHIIML